MTMNEEKEHPMTAVDEGKDGGIGGGGVGGVASEAAVSSGSQKHQTQTDDDDEEEDEPVYVESSPCSRWQKRRETVAQRDIPGIDASYLAMDTEEGVEVVWNEVLFSERKISEIQHNKVSEVFDKLIELNHMNIVKFHGYWQDRTKNDDRPRVVFITEFMSSGSLKTFLRKTKKTKQNLSKNSWRRWCIQLLSALNYLHSCEEPIIHGNLTCDTIFIQNTGLLKIGSIHYPQLRAIADRRAVAPDVLHRHVKSISDSAAKNLHFQAPEIDAEANQITTAVDIYSLGMVTLEMINLDLGGNGDLHAVTSDVVNDAIENLDNPVQKDLVLKCLESDPSRRPTARELLFHPALFEIPSLKMLSIYSLTDDMHLKSDRSFVSPTLNHSLSDQTFARLDSPREGIKPIIFSYKDCPTFDLDKLFEDVQNGLYPITAYHLLFPTHTTLNLLTKSSIPEKALTPSISFSSLQSTTAGNLDNDSHMSMPSTSDSLVFLSVDSTDSNSITSNGPGGKVRTGTASTLFERTNSTMADAEQLVNESALPAANGPAVSLSASDERERRRIIDIQCKLTTRETGQCLLCISVKFQDRVQRVMTAEIEPAEMPTGIAKELFELGLIHQDDYIRVEQSIDRAFNATMASPDPLHGPFATLIEMRKTDAMTAPFTTHALQNPFHSMPGYELATDAAGASLRTNLPATTQSAMLSPT